MHAYRRPVVNCSATRGSIFLDWMRCLSLRFTWLEAYARLEEGGRRVVDVAGREGRGVEGWRGLMWCGGWCSVFQAEEIKTSTFPTQPSEGAGAWQGIQSLSSRPQEGVKRVGPYCPSCEPRGQDSWDSHEPGRHAKTSIMSCS